MESERDVESELRPMRPFIVLWSAQALSLVGSNAVQFALIWWLTVRTGSASILALATLVGIVPQIALGPFIGAWVDRWNRKRIMLVSDAIIAAVSGVLALMFAAGSVETPAVIAALLIRSLAGAFHAPAMTASTTLMVPERHLTRIQGMNQGVQGGQLIVSAPLGAMLYALISMSSVMIVDVVTALIAIVPLLFIHVPQPVRSDATAAKTSSTIDDVLEGVRYLRGRRGHLTLLAIGAAINAFLIPAFTLLPLLVLEFGRGAIELGGLNAGFGVGTIVGGVVLGVWGGFERKMHTTLAGLVALGLATVSLGAAPTFTFALVAFGLLGACVALVNGPIAAVLQATVAPEIQGRVFTLYGTACGLVAPLGLVVAAPIAELVGVRAWYLAGGGVCLTLGVAGFFLPSLMELERGDSATPIALERRHEPG